MARTRAPLPLPWAENGRFDQGPDDYLADCGADALRDVLGSAVPANPRNRVQLALGGQADRQSRLGVTTALLNDLPFVASLAAGDSLETAAAVEELKHGSVSAKVVNGRVTQFRDYLSSANEKKENSEKAGSSGGPQPWSIHDGWLCGAYGKEDGQRRLANFVAKIECDVERRDGVSHQREYEISGVLAVGGSLPLVRVRVADFPTFEWVGAHWGAQAYLAAGPGVADQLRETIHRMSSPRKRVVHAHTGWTEIDGQKCFLHGGGGLGWTGVEVELPSDLRHYQLPEPGTFDPRAALIASLRLLDAAPRVVTVPLLAIIYLALFVTTLGTNFSLWLLAATGKWKTTLAAILQAHYGVAMIDPQRLPGSWSSTGNALEEQAFRAKDVVFVVDDFAPASTTRARLEQEQTAQRLLRAVGNSSARQRMRVDGSLVDSHPPRAMVVSTGEDLPPGHSIRGRLVVVQVDGVDLGVVSQLQRDAALLPQAVSHVVTMVGRNHDVFASWMRGRIQQSRVIFGQTLGPDVHSRVAGAMAQLFAGYELVLQFAQRVDVLDDATLEKLLEEGRQALVQLGRQQARFTVEEDPATVYVRELGSLLAQGSYVLLPEHEAPETNQKRKAQVLGWKDPFYAYVIPETSRRAVAESVRATGGTFSMSPHALHKQLADRGHIVTPQGPEKRYEVAKHLGNKQRRVLRVPLHLLESVTTDEGVFSINGIPEPEARCLQGHTQAVDVADEGPGPRAGLH